MSGGRKMKRPDLLVIGGGIHGCSAALHAARRGLDVVLVEKDTVARHASGVNAGGVRRLNRHPAELALSQLSMSLWHRIVELVDDDCGFQRCPQIRLAESEADLEALRTRVEMVRTLGFDNEVMLDEAEMRALVPAVASHCVGALASLDDGFAMPHRTTLAFCKQAVVEGVTVLEGCAVYALMRRSGGWEIRAGHMTIHAGCILNAAGAWGGDIARMIGEAAPVQVIAPMMLVTGRMPRFCDAVIGCASRPLSFKQMPNGTVVIGGARLGRADASRNRTDLIMTELACSAATAASIFPIMRDAQIVRAWSGIEGRMPDQIPVLGSSHAAAGAFHAFGFSAHGFQLAPAVGQVMAELIATGRSPLTLDAFDVGRFAAGA
jgi:sarcosine oxidase subunit beta